MLIRKEFDKPEINSPTIIVGLPGIANIGRLAVNFLVENLEAKKITEYYSNSFPALVIIDEESNVDLPRISAYHKNFNNHDYVFVIGDMQPGDDENYEFCKEMLETFKPSRIITIGGIATPERQSKPRIHGAHNNEEFVEPLEKLGLVFDGNEAVSLIMGAAGIMLGLGKIMGYKGFSLLAETLGTSNYFGIRESRAVLKILNEYCGFGLDLSKLKQEVSTYEREFKKRSRIEDEIQEYIMKHGSELDPRYIG